MSAFGGRNINSLSLSNEREKIVCGYSNRFWLLPGHTQTDQIFTLPSSARLLDTAAERKRESEREREIERESYIFNRLIFSLREGKLNTSTLPPTHTRFFFVSFGKFFYFALAWSRKEKKRERRGEDGRKRKRREERTSPQSFSPFLVRAQAPTESLCNFQSLRIQVLIKAPWGTAHNITLHFQAL